MARTLLFQPSPKESVIVMVNVMRLGQLEIGQKVDNTFPAVNMVPLVLVKMMFPLGAFTV